MFVVRHSEKFEGSKVESLVSLVFEYNRAMAAVVAVAVAGKAAVPDAPALAAVVAGGPVVPDKLADAVELPGYLGPDAVGATDSPDAGTGAGTLVAEIPAKLVASAATLVVDNADIAAPVKTGAGTAVLATPGAGAAVGSRTQRGWWVSVVAKEVDSSCQRSAKFLEGKMASLFGPLPAPTVTPQTASAKMYSLFLSQSLLLHW